MNINIIHFITSKHNAVSNDSFLEQVIFQLVPRFDIVLTCDITRYVIETTVNLRNEMIYHLVIHQSAVIWKPPTQDVGKPVTATTGKNRVNILVA